MIIMFYILKRSMICQKSSNLLTIHGPSATKTVRLWTMYSHQANLSGYRDLGSLVFRDETARFTQQTETGRSHQRLSNECITKELAHDVSLTIFPLPNRRDQTVNVFLHQYANDITGCYDYVSAVYSQASNRGVNLLRGAMEMVGLAYLSGMRYGHPCVSGTEMDVYRKHSAGLRSVNDALEDESMATSDETLVAVILLGLFEVYRLRSPTYQSYIRWLD